MSNPNKEQRSDTALTAFLGIPVLTDEQKKALTERDDHGVTPANVRRYPSYEEWHRSQHSNYNQGFFQSMPEGEEEDFSIFTPARELLAFQRLVVLHPDLVAELRQRINAKEGPSVDEETNRILWQSYELMAVLTDINDEFGKLEGDQHMRLPSGQINPDYLMQ
jgi:hypothetical protein